MARGVDTSRWPQRQITRRIGQEAREQTKIFGVVLGPQDSGERSGAQPHVPAGATIEDRTIKWNQRAAPVGGVFEGAPADAIRLAQMKTNREHAMAALMQHPPSGGGASKMVDIGMSGRLSAGKFPVHSYRDERIMLKPEGSEDRASQFHGAHESAHDNEPHPDQD